MFVRSIVRRLSTLNKKEMEQFQKLSQWWTPNGPMKMLYLYNYQRIKFLRSHVQSQDEIQPFKGLNILDVGCGAGFLSQSMTRLGAKVTGIDPNPTSYRQAVNHKGNNPSLTNLIYHNTTIEDFLKNKQQFDIVTSMQVVEHVDQPNKFIQLLSLATKKQGLVMLSTIARTKYSWLTHIAMAQYLFNIVPKGTHHHEKFINPPQLSRMMSRYSIQEIDRLELQVNWEGNFQKKLGGSNYLMMGRKVN